MFAKPLTFYHDNRRLIVVGLLALFIGLPLVAVLHKKADTVTLTAEESAWLKAHPVIRVAPDPDFPPTEFFDSNGEYSGIAADYLALLQKKLGIRFKIVKLRDWAEVLKKARQREVDVLAAVTKTPERSEFLCFTKPYLEFPAVIITRDTYAGPLNLKSLAGKRMSVKAGYGARYYVITNYPNIRVDVVPDINTGLRKVSFGMRDALLENLLTASYYMEKEVINNLRIAGETEYVYRMAFAVRNDWPVLRGILDKGLNLITSDERDVIYNKWVPLNAQFLLINKRITPPLVMVAGLLVLFVVLVFFWNRSLTRQVSARTRELNSELSERCRIESALRESEQKFRVLAETSPVAIILYQGEDLVYINPSLSKLTGYSKHQLMSMKFWEWTDGDAQLTVKAYGMARQQGEPVPESYEAKFRTKDGEQKCVMVSAGIIQYRGELAGLASVFDITDRKRMEEELLRANEDLEQRTEQLTSLTAELSRAEEHERRRIATELHDQVAQTLALSKIKLSSLQLSGMNEENREHIAEVMDHLSTSIEEIRSLTFQLSPPILHEVGLEAALEWLSEEFQNKYGLLITFRHDNKPKPLEDDIRGALYQMSRELLVNIIKHARATSVLIEVFSMPGNVAVRIADDGIGFDLSKKLFNQGNHGSFGLLNIHHRIKHLGGELNIDSKPSRGTIATLVLPFSIDITESPWEEFHAD